MLTLDLQFQSLHQFPESRSEKIAKKISSDFCHHRMKWWYNPSSKLFSCEQMLPGALIQSKVNFREEKIKQTLRKSEPSLEHLKGSS